LVTYYVCDRLLSLDPIPWNERIKKKAEEAKSDYKTHRREFSFNSFKRSFTIDDKIDSDNIQARYTNGVLQLLLPKKEEVKVLPKAITIQ
ncbi:MAG TPA: Hsp20/alpha crystallin family protein, partial [Chitinophagaceae bacterium]|nr:Hsp20/alpha crystallin family protein [Chitinophagaceae bacterium]